MSSKVAKKTITEAGSEFLFEVIRFPLVTEKSTFLTGNNQYSFKVAGDATKSDVKAAVERVFKVDVLTVRTLNVAGKAKVFKGRRGRRSGFKKAIVRLKAGHTIDASVGV